VWQESRKNRVSACNGLGKRELVYNFSSLISWGKYRFIRSGMSPQLADISTAIAFEYLVQTNPNSVSTHIC
jgi:hypothetical protein